ncbi:hypothetical protein ACWIYZ_11335 [Ursidibacter arcticus]
MYEPDKDYKLSVEDFLYVMNNKSTNICEEFINNYSCLSVQYIIDYLKNGSKNIPDLEDNDFLHECCNFGDVLHIFEDKSGIGIFEDEQYIFVADNAKSVDDYLLVGVCFDEDEPYIFMPRELLIISKDLNLKFANYKHSIDKLLKLYARFSKGNQGKRKIREAEAEVIDIERSIDLTIEKGFYRL